jgi:hypothetical protein
MEWNKGLRDIGDMRCARILRGGDGGENSGRGWRSWRLNIETMRSLRWMRWPFSVIWMDREKLGDDCAWNVGWVMGT